VWDLPKAIGVSYCKGFWILLSLSLSLSLNRVSCSFSVLTKLLKACKSLQSLGASLEMGGKGRNNKV
jgi:hypothetical protein